MTETYRTREERKSAEKANRQTRRIKKAPSPWKKLLIGFLIFSFICLSVMGITVYAFIKDAPELDQAKLADPLSSKFYDKDGNFIHEYGTEHRTKISYGQIPKQLEEAILATEDNRFYEHKGVDLLRTAKAVFVNVTSEFGSQGGSTITQQVIKNSFLTPEKTIKRKVQEWYLAYKLEQQYSKEEILAMYVNKINLGNRSYGVAAAAENYYGLDVNELDQLTLTQAAMMAGLTQSPNNYDPTKQENLKAATDRRNTVLTLMNRHGYISNSDMEAAKQVAVTEGMIEGKQRTGMPYEAFLDAAVKEVETKLTDVDITKDGLKIYLTLDPEAQQLADSILEGNHVTYPNEHFQTAFVFMDSKTGEVRAIGSGRNEHKTTFRGHNLATSLKRQPGSTFKPIFDYGPAIEYLKWSTYHQVEDAPYQYSTGDPIRNAYTNYRGMMSIREALIESRNIPALKTLESVGLEKAKTFSEALGITYPNGEVYESYSIGSNVVSPLELAGAFGAFAHEGIYTKPRFVAKVEFPDGKVVDFQTESKRVMQDYTAYMVTDMLRGVINAPNGTGRLAAIPGVDLVGKTGTTNFDEKVINQFGYPHNATSDSWFAGYTTNYTMAVWTGYARNGNGNYLTPEDTRISHTIFKTMMQAYAGGSGRFEQPESVEKIQNELYIKGVERDMVPPAPISKKEVQKKQENAEKNSGGKKKEKEKKEKKKGKGNNKGKEKD
ncbi:PBP1A family penicillin-binding protein [Bacillus sp. B15-48]|uniref:transglycosylase domain-containing protein n=1 Tax=Bacillus sp. B15-48 TaxID=1548601 RepID=UPI00193FB798|nr:PBP1A family penicillin-binding protein [Bacillus sp. B15-48]MBM4763823.1 PBP1A family penicillin-binding protein [Bacillus sp. B15-48]